MAHKRLDRESFVQVAVLHGFDPADPHLDELYPWVESTLNAVEPLEKLDVTGVEPDVHFHPGTQE